MAETHYTLAICITCGRSIDMGLCTYGCDEDAVHENDRTKVLWRTYNTTGELVKEWAIEQPDRRGER